MTGPDGQPTALFRREGDAFVPSLLTTGPWQADAMHGGPPSALVGRAVERATEGGFVARLNVELVRPVPLVPLVATAVRREISRRVTHVDVTVSTSQGTVVSARALVLAVAPMPAPAWQPDTPPPELLDESHRVEPPAWTSGDVPLAYHRHAVEHRMPNPDSFASPGPAVSWVRLQWPLVAGEETSGLCRLLAAADFGSGISAIYGDNDRVGLINADLSVALQRPPTDEWVRIEAVTTIDESGAALAVSQLGDRRGPLGVATQSLLGLRF